MKYDIEQLYKADIYIMIKGEKKLIKKNEVVIYFDDEDRWISFDDYFNYVVNPIFYEDFLSEEKIKEAERKLPEVLMPYKNIQDGDKFVDAYSIEVYLPLEKNRKKPRISKGKGK